MFSSVADARQMIRLASAPSSVLPSRNGHRGERRYAADGRCARRKWRCTDKRFIPLRRRRTTGLALTRKGIDVGVITDGRVSWVEPVIQRLHDDHKLILLRIRQAEMT